MHATLSSRPHFAVSPERETLQHIRQDDVNLAIWRRAPLPRLAEFFDQLVATDLLVDLTVPDARSADAALAAHPTLRNHLADGRMHQWIDDLEQLTALFAEISGATAIRLRLETVRGQDCAVFHEDAVRLRLLCTYRGPGTQWLEETNCRREELGLRGRTIPAANDAIVIDPSYIRTIPAWAVAIFKGRGHPSAQGRGLIHRSYPVSSAAEARVRLCLDAV